MCREPERQDPYVHRLAKDLVQYLALFLAETVAELLQSVLTHPSKGLVDASNAPPLTPKFWVQAIYTELLHASSRYRAVREQKRPTTGLAKVICLSFDTKARPDHEKKKSSATSHETMLGSSSWANTLYVWFPAAWMPLVVEAVRARTMTGLQYSMQQGAVARNASSSTVLPVNRELRFRLKRWHVDRKRQSPTRHARANVDWLSLNIFCVTQMFSLLREGILRDIFSQKASTAWHPASVDRVVVSLLLPGSMDADEWLFLARKKRHMWPTQTASQVAALGH